MAPLHVQLTFDDPPTAMDIDMDLDIDLGEDHDLTALEAGAISQESRQSTLPTLPISPPGPTVDLAEPVPTKVHLRGLDNLSTSNIKAFTSEHSSPEFLRIEWIDDTSANIVYETPDLASSALTSFTADPSEAASLPPLHLRKAKPLSSHSTATLYVRQATVGDLKKPRARDASRFYLLNPDKDPRERRRRNDRFRRDAGGEYRRRRRRDEEEPTPVFDVSMYDDNAGDSLSLDVKTPGTRRTRRRSESVSSHESSGMTNSDRNGGAKRRRVRFVRRDEDADLFAKKAVAGGRRLRDRSASPGREEGDGRLGFGAGDNAAARASKIRTRSLTPPPPYRSKDPYADVGKELFAATAPAKGATELFPSRSSPPKPVTAGRELFPNKTGTSNHRRTDALDASADEAADLFASGMTVPFVDGAGDARTGRGNGGDLFGRIGEGKGTVPLGAKAAGGGGDLFSRINGGAPLNASASYGRFADSAAITKNGHSAAVSSHEPQGFSIKGTGAGFAAAGNTASVSTDPELSKGFSIRGLSAKELFPIKAGAGAGAGNQGVELFGEKIRGRGGVGVRKRAEDLFF